GGILFAQNCLRCHGPQGKGDGPEGVRLPSQPLDLTASRTRSLRDGDIFLVIRGGRGYMPGWQGRLSEPQIWDLVNYIRTLSEHE
ncbi:MAG: cytochrome c, partial [Chloroflexota bacterium]|nr:cytochrome c [Chloroflexota bacterium]